MATFPYFVLVNSTNTVEKKFRVVLGGRRRTLKKSTNVETTVNGELDISSGSIREIHQYIVKVRETEPETGYGNINDLEYFFRLNSPNASPSMVLTLIDHFGNSHNAIMIGDFSDNLLGIMIEGATAWSTVETTYIFKD